MIRVAAPPLSEWLRACSLVTAVRSFQHNRPSSSHEGQRCVTEQTHRSTAKFTALTGGAVSAFRFVRPRAVETGETADNYRAI